MDYYNFNLNKKFPLFLTSVFSLSGHNRGKARQGEKETLIFFIHNMLRTCAEERNFVAKNL